MVKRAGHVRTKDPVADAEHHLKIQKSVYRSASFLDLGSERETIKVEPNQLKFGLEIYAEDGCILSAYLYKALNLNPQNYDKRLFGKCKKTVPVLQKMLGEKTFFQLADDKLFWQYNEESNSIATIVKHLWGNMLSRWTDFLTSDGEKEWRKRDAEFENDIISRQELLDKWTEGWNCLFQP